MSPYKRSFLELALDANALKFGEFTLKSGRVSPYFFNASAFSSGLQLQILGQCYRDAIAEHGVEFDGLFGPAYSGIPLALSCCLADQGFTGVIQPKGKERSRRRWDPAWRATEWADFAIDDVVTAEQPYESVDFIGNHGAVCVCVAVDRQERGREGTGSHLLSSETFNWSRCQL